MERKELGRITSARFGYGGYNDAMMGLSLSFGGDAWGCGTFEGGWAFPQYAKAVHLLLGTLKAAKVRDIAALDGVPVEVTFDGNVLKSWRVLTEVL